ncbi:hypothetical protein ROE7235_03080 [Roseibaca ekhonensis]|uniref:Recombinase family protein n=1 Tax=Roseinatronobacter ekhonensis TaxID=254356 RepID=A0A3B0MBR4_9RHOB|nr:recombinase family protein [Roseibaca ekhonensis]SUZ33311.1 hypothetical protein ROE7235_03080 [Roseibaca ekhonensis]
MRAAIYSRFSSAMQSDASIEDQARLCAAWAAREDWPVVARFEDRAISGASMVRPGLQALLEAAQAGKFDILLTEALDRLSRDQADVAAIYKRLSFAGVTIVTLAEGEISELHVGLKGTMNQLFLKDLAAKTRRGLRGRVEAGRSGGGNSYGYTVVRRLGEDGLPVTGEREIDPAEAKVVQRVFREFAEGQSPKAIARRLNDDQIPGPRGKLWRDTAIRGHQQRGTGLLNNELYIGKLVWNRLRYVKDPETGRRVSRQNPKEDWIIADVPELRIIDDTLWQRVKARQGEITGSDRVQNIKATRFWEKRRHKHLLTGLLKCGCCGGGFASVGRDYVACSNARKLRTCNQRKSFLRSTLEAAVLDLLHNKLMQPEAVAAFVAEFTKEMNAANGQQSDARARLVNEEAQIKRKLEGLYDAIADGLRTTGLKDKLLGLEARLAEIARELAEPAPSPVRLHPNLSELYRRKVEQLADSLRDPAIRPAALDTIRTLIEAVTVHIDDMGEVTLALDGALSAMIDTSQPGVLRGIDASSVKVVAGTGFEPVTFRL